MHLNFNSDSFITLIWCWTEDVPLNNCISSRTFNYICGLFGHVVGFSSLLLYSSKIYFKSFDIGVLKMMKAEASTSASECNANVHCDNIKSGVSAYE